VRQSIDEENGGKSPYVGTRVSRRQRDRLKVIARQRGCTVAELVRDAIDRMERELSAAGPPGTTA